jgi:hypothetical protein
VGKLDPTFEITVNLFDRDLVGQDFLGKVVVPLSVLLEDEGDSVERWFTLLEEPTETFNKGPKLPGEIQLKLHYPKVELVLLLFTYSFPRELT